MATTHTVKAVNTAPAILGGYHVIKYVINWDAYVAGGYSLASELAKLGNVVDYQFGEGDGSANTLWIPHWDGANDKVKLIVGSTGVEVAGAVDVSALITVVTVWYTR